MNVILASASPRRSYLFRQVGIQFEVDPSSIEEIFPEAMSPPDIVEYLAKIKAEDVALRHPNEFLIAADTIVCIDNEILGKPEDSSQAAEFLARLSGRTHDVYSGVCAGSTDGSGKISSGFSFFERTKVTFSALSDLEIEKYIETGKPTDKAGSYGIQDDLGSLFVEKIEGDYYNVVGFPLNKFYQSLKKEMPGIHSKIFFQTS